MDECLVTKKTMSTHAWTPLKTNITLDYSEFYAKAQAIIVSVSRENGVELV